MNPCSRLNKWIAERLGRPGRLLREGLLNISGDWWTDPRIMYHPAVADAPFATAAPETLALTATRSAAPAAPPLDHAQVRAALAACSEAGDCLATALLPMINAASGSLDVATRSITAWYEAARARLRPEGQPHVIHINDSKHHGYRRHVSGTCSGEPRTGRQ